MKNAVVLLFTFLLVLSCGSDDDNQNINSTVIGNWKLIEIFSDPGNGGGDFSAVSSDKIIEFNANGSLSSNGNLCTEFTDAGEPSTGTYSEIDSTFIIAGCPIMTSITASYEIVDSNLIVSYICIESCREKYEKVE